MTKFNLPINNIKQTVIKILYSLIVIIYKIYDWNIDFKNKISQRKLVENFLNKKILS